MTGIPHRYLTAGLPGIGGVIKRTLDDFVVEEVPLYEPCGEGEHVYFEIEKTDLSTFEALEQLATAFRRETRDIGFAGMKDRKGITRQVFSIDRVSPEFVESLTFPQMRVLWARRHGNKLRMGHLRGNRFRLRVHDVAEGERGAIESILAEVDRRGIPNYYGPQRFGVRGEAQHIGGKLLRGEHRSCVWHILGHPSVSENNPDVVRARYLFLQYRWIEALESFPPSYREERRILRSLLRRGEDYRLALREMRPEVVRLYLSSFQSWLFNQTLDERMDLCGGDLSRFLVGDVAYLHRNGALFIVDDPDAIVDRARSFEISPSGPIFGKRMLRPSAGPQCSAEDRLLDGHRLVHGDFDCLESWCNLAGGRRPFRVRVENLEWRLEGSELHLSFFLPRGSYATTLLRELMKNEVVPPAFTECEEA